MLWKNDSKPFSISGLLKTFHFSTLSCGKKVFAAVRQFPLFHIFLYYYHYYYKKYYLFIYLFLFYEKRGFHYAFYL